MSLRTHRQRVPAMLAVAVVGMLVYSAAGAAPDDGKDLGPAKPSTTTTTSKCEPSTSTTRKDGDKEPTTSTTRKDGDKEPTTSTTAKDGDNKDGDAAAAKAAAPTGVDLDGAAFAAAAKDAEPDEKASKAAADKDCGPTTTTRKGDGGGKDDDGKGSTTSTTRKRPTTTTTEKKDDGDKGSTTTTTRQSVEPHTPNPADPGTGGSPEPDGSADPGGTPISPQEAPPVDAPDSDPGPAAEQPEAAADPGPVDDDESFDMWDDDEDYVALDPMEAPGSGSPLPVFNQLKPSSAEKASSDRRDRSRSTGGRSRGTGRVQDYDDPATGEVAYSPEALTSRSLTPAAVVESESARRRLGGARAAVTESAFPADVISTPGETLNRRNPLAAAALVLLVGVARELFKVWRRRAYDFWPA